MNIQNIKTLEQVKMFLDGTVEVDFAIETKEQRYQFIENTLIDFDYLKRSKKEKGWLLCFLEKVSGYSRIQVKRLVRKYFQSGSVKPSKPSKRRGFQRIYTNADIELLANTDELHNILSGSATKKLCERAFLIYKDDRYERLQLISIAHLYNLRRSKIYQRHRLHFEKTKPKTCSIGERRKPKPNGKPGYLRVDTVHQGDFDKTKGVYYINAVDEVTQFEIVSATEKISEMFLIPVLEQLIEQFPFTINGFHCDNGSEYINRAVADLLNKLLIELTKSRPRRSTDNGLVESKNGSIIRKCLGYTHIPQKFARLINEFLREYLNPYVNYHRPSFFPIRTINKKGKQITKYPYKMMMTPYEKLKSLEQAEEYLKVGNNFTKLDENWKKISDNKAAEKLNEAREKLFEQINEQENKKRRN